MVKCMHLSVFVQVASDHFANLLVAMYMLVYLTAVQLTLANCIYIAHLPHLKVRLFRTSFFTM